jgi:Glycosyl hydrolase family 63 C-terminal domain
LDEHGADALISGSRNVRNKEWFHMINDDIISMPDKWEYPWYAAWDLAFHTMALAVVDIDFAKQQLDLMLQQLYLHPSGQIPAYEWNFSDVNPPVHAWAALFLYNTERLLRGEVDLEFLKRAFDKLVVNFTWWVNRKDRFGKNVFEGGFLGLDNIGVFDRSAPLPTGGYLEQADGTAWMALCCQNMLEIAVELSAHDPTYEALAIKFMEHFFWIAVAINRIGTDGLWDEEDGFYYDLLRLPDGTATRLKVRSMVGLLPLCATTVAEKYQRERVPRAVAQMRERLSRMPEVMASIHPTGEGHLGVAERGIVALVNPDKLRRMLARMLDENEFLSEYGLRALSRYHAQNPYRFGVGGQEYRVDYLPAESNSGVFGGNSNWRGPIWFPVNVLVIRALLQFYLYYGNNFKVECPTGSGRLMNLFEVSQEIFNRLTRIFLRDEHGRRPVFGGAEKFQTDPYWRDNILFYEYFHGDNGAGIGASHQTGWTGTIARLIEIFGRLDAEQFLSGGKLAGGVFRAA